nr:ribonuclease H-like domain-containing protein [Tanacetum cinerariifolium]
MDHQYPTVAKIPVLDTGKFEQWQFRIQQYLQHEHYALWEVIEFDDSYKVPTNTDPDDTTTKRDADQPGRTVTFTTEDMQKKKNDVKARTTLLLSLPDEHQLSNEDGNTICVTTASTAFTTGSVNVATISQDTASAYIASQSNGSQIKFKDINQIDEDDMEEMDINWNMALLSMRADKASKSQERGRKESYRQGSKAEEKSSKALMAIDGVGWDWSYMANEEDHALVADGKAPTEFALMANIENKSSSHRSSGHRLHGAPMRPPFRSSGHSPHEGSMRPSHRSAGHRPHGPSMNPRRPIMNGARPYKSFFIQSPSYKTRPFLKSSRKFTTGSTKNHTVDVGRKGKAIKPSSCWTWNPSQKLSNKGPNNNSVSVMFKKYTYIDTQGRLKIVLGRNFKLLDDTNILLRIPRQHNMYSIDLNNIVPHKDLTCLVAKASADECILWHRRLGHLNVKTMNKLVRPAGHRPHGPSMNPCRPTMNGARPYKSFFQAPS